MPAIVSASVKALRLLRFPLRHSLGHLAVRPNGAVSNLDWKSVGKARGLVVVKEDREVRLDVDAGAEAHVHALAMLGPDALAGLSLRDREISDRTVEAFRHLAGLRGLDLGRTSRAAELSPRLTKVGLGLVAQLPSLAGLNLSGRTLDGDAVASLGEADELRWLDLSKARLDSGAVAALSVLPRLQALKLQAARGDVDILSSLPIDALQGIRSLDVSNVRLDGHGLTRLSAMKSLRMLYLSGNEIVDDQLYSLRGMQGLSWLDLWDTSVTPGAVEAMRRSLPACRIAY
jgi:hypothetical protein